MSYFTIRKSLFGRLLGISSTGGLVMGVSSTGGVGAGSSDVAMAAQMWGPEMQTTITSSIAQLTNSGVSIVSSAVPVGSPLGIAAPVTGVNKTVVFNTPSSSMTLGATAAGFLFQTTASFLAASGSSILTILGSTLGINGSLTLVGRSSAVWQLTAKTVAATS